MLVLVHGIVLVKKDAMPRKRPLVALSDDERAGLLELIRTGKAAARTIARAQVLLQADEGRPDEEIAGSLPVGRATVERVRKRFAQEGLERALRERPRPGAARRLGGKQEAFLVALACSDPPDGRDHWTMQLLADRLVTLEQVDAISDETVRRTLKKTSSSRG
jgi:transposase